MLCFFGCAHDHPPSLGSPSLGAHAGESADRPVACYRLPALIYAGNGTLLAFASARNWTGDGQSPHVLPSIYIRGNGAYWVALETLFQYRDHVGMAAAAPLASATRCANAHGIPLGVPVVPVLHRFLPSTTNQNIRGQAAWHRPRRHLITPMPSP